MGGMCHIPVVMMVVVVVVVVVAVVVVMRSARGSTRGVQ